MREYYDIEVSLSGFYPPIWRRFLLKADGTTFADLHRAIQDACGWLDYHLYRFDEPGKNQLSQVAQSQVDRGWDDDPTPAAHEVALSPWIGRFTPRACRYTYDFGDSWHHDVVVRGKVFSEDRFYRRLVGGEHAFPPEDCGGMPGFERILHYLGTGEDLFEDEGIDLGEWIGDWRPEADMKDLGGRFDAKSKPRKRG